MKTRANNYRLTVTPYTRFMNDDQVQALCRTMKEDIKRHVDDVQGVDIEYDEICVYCGFEPEPDRFGEPACCNDAQNDWKKENHEHVFAFDPKRGDVQKTCTICEVVQQE